jgi:catechol 2,3-dioxygenase-like lactoylglutathione lyase family enzyme
MKIRHIDHIGINVENLDDTKVFFTDLGFTVTGEMVMQGELVDRVTGLTGVKDDLADAFSLLLLKILEEDQGEPSVYIIDMGSSLYDRYSPLGNLNEDRLTFDTKF